MPPPKSNTDKSSTVYGESDETYISPRCVSLSLSLEGLPGPGDWSFLLIFNGLVVLDGKWRDELEFQLEALPLDLKNSKHKDFVCEKPLMFLLRLPSPKGSKDPDPLMSLDNRAGATVDLFPLLIGEECISLRVPLVTIDAGQATGCFVNIEARASEPSENDKSNVPFLMTMVSAHCLPMAKDGTVYVAAMSLDGIIEQPKINFGLSLSFADAKRIVWASASSAGQAANTALSVPNEDIFILDDFSPIDNEECRSFYWNSMNRRRVDPNILRERLTSPLVVEVAGVPRSGKAEARGRYMAFVDAHVLLQPGQFGVTICTKLMYYNEANLPENVAPLLDLPPTSAKKSGRDAEFLTDELGHTPYIVLRLDLWECLVPKLKIANLFETIKMMPRNGPASPVDQLDLEYIPVDTSIDVRKIRKEGGALAVHKELSGLACRGAVPMNQGIKRTAANRLLMRVRSMLKQFPPGDCSYTEWQETVMAQHSACRRAVCSSFAPQPPQLYPPPRVAAARSRMAGDNKTANIHIERNLKGSLTTPRALICKVLRCLEKGNDVEAKKCLLDALNGQPRNRFLLWILGGQEYDKGVESYEIASAALSLAVKGDHGDGTANTIGWGASHTLYHFNENHYGAFVSAKKMRASYELPREWKKFLQRWIDESGEEETYWIPAVVSADNPLMITAAFFLCLRCFTFVEKILECVERGCGTKGSRFKFKTVIGPEVYYLRAASLILQNRFDAALKLTTEGINKFRTDPMLYQMRVICLIGTRGWDEKCEDALNYAEGIGAESAPAMLLTAALGAFKTDPELALQRAARAHKIVPCGHSALVIARIYIKMKELGLAERWAAVAVKYEPLLADGWAVLALIAMFNKHLDKARSMLRTAKQLGTISPDIGEEVQKMINVVQLDPLPETLMKDRPFVLLVEGTLCLQD